MDLLSWLSAFLILFLKFIDFSAALLKFTSHLRPSPFQAFWLQILEPFYTIWFAWISFSGIFPRFLITFGSWEIPYILLSSEHNFPPYLLQRSYIQQDSFHWLRKNLGFSGGKLLLTYSSSSIWDSHPKCDENLII